MSETPRNDESPEYRDPTAPSDPTQQVPTGDTQHLPATPEPASPSTPPVPPAPGYGPPPAASQPFPQGPQNPYAAPPAQGAQNPYGAPPPPPQFQPPYPSQEQVQSGSYGPGYAAPPVQYGQPRSMSGNTIALLVVSGLATFGCLFGIPALIFAIIAATKTQEPAEQAKYTRYGWIAFGVTLLLVVIGIIAVIAIGLSSGTSSYDSSY